MDRLFGDGWPAFSTADQVVKRYIDQVRRLFADLELVLLDADDVLVAAGWAVPIRWDGGPAHLPEGYTDSLVRAVEGHQRGDGADTMVVMAAQVAPRSARSRPRRRSIASPPGRARTVPRWTRG